MSYEYSTTGTAERNCHVKLIRNMHAKQEDVVLFIVESVTHRKDPLWVTFCPHVGVMDLFEDHPCLIVFPILEAKFRQTYRKFMSNPDAVRGN